MPPVRTSVKERIGKCLILSFHLILCLLCEKDRSCIFNVVKYQCLSIEDPIRYFHHLHTGTDMYCWSSVKLHTYTYILKPFMRDILWAITQ